MTIDETLRLFYDSSSHLYCIISLDDNAVIYSNPSFKVRLRNLSSDAPSALLDYVHPDDKEYVVSSYRRCVSRENIGDFDCRIILDEGERHYKITAVLLPLYTGQFVIACCGEDVTDVKAYINILNEHNKKKNSILNIVCHDLMGPIGIIQSISGHLRNNAATFDVDKVQQFVNVINKTSKHCIELIRNFISQEFLESAKVNLNKSRIELVNKMEALIEEYKAGEPQLKKQFKLQANSDKIYAELDEDKFFQTINNLISNSMKFTKEDGNITVSIEERDVAILISVEDDGIGIRGEESIGLEMSIIKNIIDWHDGKVWFESEENKGTTFYIEIPK